MYIDISNSLDYRQNNAINQRENESKSKAQTISWIVGWKRGQFVVLMYLFYRNTRYSNMKDESIFVFLIFSFEKLCADDSVCGYLAVPPFYCIVGQNFSDLNFSVVSFFCVFISNSKQSKLVLSTLSNKFVAFSPYLFQASLLLCRKNNIAS